MLFCSVCLKKVTFRNAPHCYNLNAWVLKPWTRKHNWIEFYDGKLSKKCWYRSTYEYDYVLINLTQRVRNAVKLLALYRSFSLTWSVAPVGWWNNTKYLNKKELIPVPYTNMAAISLFWYTNMAAVTSDENDL